MGLLCTHGLRQWLYRFSRAAAVAGISPGLKLIPSAVLWGYFAYMAADSLPGSQFWDRLLLLGTDPRKRYACAAPPRFV